MNLNPIGDIGAVIVPERDGREPARSWSSACWKRREGRSRFAAQDAASRCF